MKDLFTLGAPRVTCLETSRGSARRLRDGTLDASSVKPAQKWVLVECAIWACVCKYALFCFEFAPECMGVLSVLPSFGGAATVDAEGSVTMEAQVGATSICFGMQRVSFQCEIDLILVETTPILAKTLFLCNRELPV